jgi:ThiF family protein
MNEENRYGRIDSLIDRPVLQALRVLVIGLGSMGGFVIENLVRHGLGTSGRGKVYLCDGDTVEARNTTCSPYTEKHFGMNKAIAMAGILKAINKNVSIEIRAKNIEANDAPEIERMAASGMLDCILLLANDSPEVMNRISMICYPHCAMVRAAFDRHCDSARIAFSIPGRTCSLSQIFGRNNTRRRPANSESLGTDTRYVTDHVCRVVLSVLLRKTERRLRRVLVPLYMNGCFIFIVLRRRGGSSGGIFYLETPPPV